MLINERKLRSIVREIISEQIGRASSGVGSLREAQAQGANTTPAAAPAATQSKIVDGEYSDPDDMNYRYRVLNGKYYILGRPGAPAGTFKPQPVTNPQEIARIQGQIRKLNQTAVPSNVVSALAAAAGAMVVGAAMPAQSALLSFVGMRKQPYNFTDPTYRRCMWYVVQAAMKRLGGRPGLIDYSDYYNAQRLDPQYKANPAGTWQHGARGPTALISPNPYCQLSVTFGHCNFKQQGDEYLVYDRYEFILDRDPSIVEASNDYLLGLPVIKRTLESFKAGGLKSVVDFEGLLVAYQNTFGYRGFPTTITTLKPDTGALGLAKAYAAQFVPDLGGNDQTGA